MQDRINRVIGVLNYKGGTGKTTTVVNLAAGLAMRGVRVLCVDLDPQGSLAAHFGVRYHDSLTDLLLGDAEPQACTYRARENIDILPSDRGMLKAEKELWNMDDMRVARRVLADKLRPADDGYGFVIVDFPPSVTLISQNGLLYISELIIPMHMSHLSVVGTRQVLGTLKAIGHIPDHQVRLLFVLPTLYSGRLRKDREILEQMRHMFGDKLAEPIRENVKLAEAPAHQQTIFEYDPRSNGAEDYTRFVRQVIRADSFFANQIEGIYRRPD
ncbi:MAG: ParA family protein [Chloroflexi bacterium]|nr:ParA family protein [Chloroflexota bacterium]